jgi:hypothetical protein
MSKYNVEHLEQKSAVEFLATTIKEMKAAGLLVAVKNVTAKPDRPAGVILFVGDVTLAGGALGYAPLVEEKAETA